MKTCTKCGLPKPLDEFIRDRSRPDGRTPWCRDCRRERDRQFYEDHREERREYDRQLRAGIKAAVFDHYGWQCACCGSTSRLSIDHMNGDGAQHRAELGSDNTLSLCRWIITNGFPDGFQTLCFPCNNSKKNGAHCRLNHEVAA